MYCERLHGCCGKGVVLPLLLFGDSEVMGLIDAVRFEWVVEACQMLAAAQGAANLFLPHMDAQGTIRNMRTTAIRSQKNIGVEHVLLGRVPFERALAEASFTRLMQASGLS